MQEAPAAFEQPAAPSPDDGVKEELYAQIGRLKMQLEWLKKKLGPYLPATAPEHDR